MFGKQNFRKSIIWFFLQLSHFVVEKNHALKLCYRESVGEIFNFLRFQIFLWPKIGFPQFFLFLLVFIFIQCTKLFAYLFSGSNNILAGKLSADVSAPLPHCKKWDNSIKKASVNTHSCNPLPVCLGIACVYFLYYPLLIVKYSSCYYFWRRYQSMYNVYKKKLNHIPFHWTAHKVGKIGA